MSKSFWFTPLATLTIVALASSACATDAASGLATLESETATSADVGSPTGVDDAQAQGEASPATADSGSAATSASNANAEATAAPDDDTDLTEEQRLLDFAQCMRDNGVDFPDPVVEADGTIAFGRRPARTGETPDDEGIQEIGRDPDLPAARAACSGIIEGLALGPGGQNFDQVQVELTDQLLEFAQCMRDNGVNVADPDPNSFGPGGGRPFGGLDFDDTDVEAAFEICGEQLQVRRGPGAGS